MNENFEITVARSDDISDILEINEESNVPEGWSYSSLLYEMAGGNRFYFVAKFDGEVVGYIGYAQILDEAHILNIAVRKSFRRQGVGEALLKKAFEKAVEAKITGMTLEVRASNAAAIAMYEKNGFESAGIRKRFYKDKEDAVIYWKYFKT